MNERGIKIEHNIELPTKGLDFGLYVLRSERHGGEKHDPNAVAAERKINPLNGRAGVEFFAADSLLLGVGASEGTDGAMVNLPFLT